MLTVYTTTNPRHAALFEIALRDAGVDFRLENANSAFTSEIGPIPAIPIGFLVRDEDADRARRAIEDALQRIGEGPKRQKRADGSS